MTITVKRKSDDKPIEVIQRKPIVRHRVVGSHDYSVRLAMYHGRKYYVHGGDLDDKTGGPFYILV